MGQLRVEKVQELIKQEVSKMILRELKDPRIGFVTVTQVDVTGDLRYAKIYVFFFQAEDGIRDLIVTGVQTCALPICLERATGLFMATYAI